MNFKFCDAELCNVDNSYYLFDCYTFEILKVEEEYVSYVRELIQCPEEYEFKNMPIEIARDVIMSIQKGNFFRKFCVGKVSMGTSHIIPTYSFTPIHRCNLDCVYCFAKAGNNYVEKQRKLQQCTIDNMNLFMCSKFKNTKMRVEFVGGGEPLLHLEAVKSIVGSLQDETSNKQYFVQLVTNGTLLDEDTVRWIDKNNIKLCISIDGNADIQNIQRKYKNGVGTYIDVVCNIKKIFSMNELKSYTKDIWAVSVLTTHCESIYEIINHHISLGIKSMEIRVARGDENNLILLNKKTLCHFKKLYYDLTYQLLEDVKRGRCEGIFIIANNYDTFGKIIKRLVSKEKVIYRCGAGKWKFSCTANGDIYPCDSFVGNKEFVIGNVNDGYIDEKIIDNFSHASVESSRPCNICKFRYLCGGDCYYNAFINNSEIDNCDTSFCQLNKYLCSLAIHLVSEVKRIPHIYSKLKEFIKAREIMSI